MKLSPFDKWSLLDLVEKTIKSRQKELTEITYEKKSSFGAIVFTLGFEQVHFTKSQRIYLVSDKKTEKAK